MCDPVSLTVAAAGTAVAGQVYSGMQSAKQGKQQYEIANRQSDEVLASASMEAGRIRKAADAGRGAAVAGMAASGVQIGEGSALEVERQILKVGEEDAMMTLLNADRQALSIRQQGRMAKDAGYAGARGAAISAAGTVLGAAAQYNTWGGGSQYNYRGSELPGSLRGGQ